MLVYGTGYYYPPVIIAGTGADLLPLSVHLCRRGLVQPGTGAWARGGTIYGPYGGAATGGSYYNPNTGAWAHGGAIYGPNGGAGAWSAYNPSTGSYAHGSASWSNGSGSANASYYNARTGVSGSTNQNCEPVQPLGIEQLFGSEPDGQYAERQQRQRAGRKLQLLDRRQGRRLPKQRHRQQRRRASKRKTATCMPGTTATSINIPTAAGRNTTTAPGTRCSRPSRNTTQSAGAKDDSPAARSAASAARARAGTMERGNYQQLEQDRLGRQAGSGRWGGARGAGSGGPRSRQR